MRQFRDRTWARALALLALLTFAAGLVAGAPALAGTTASYHVRVVRVFGETSAPGAAMAAAGDDAVQVVVPGDEPWGTREQLGALARSLDADKATAVSGFLVRTNGAPLYSFQRTFYVGEAAASLRVDARPPESEENLAHRLHIVVTAEEGGSSPLAEARIVARTQRTVALAAPSPIAGEWIVVAVTPLDASATTVRVERERERKALLAGVGGVGTPELEMTTKVQPVYPSSARDEGREGAVFIQAIIDEEGRVRAPQVLKTPEGSEDLAAAAVDAVSRWRYRPALKDGEPVAVYFTVMVNFTLE